MAVGYQLLQEDPHTHTQTHTLGEIRRIRAELGIMDVGSVFFFFLAGQEKGNGGMCTQANSLQHLGALQRQSQSLSFLQSTGF